MKPTPDGKKELSETQKQELVSKIKSARSYLKAYEDLEFMGRKDVRPVRFQLELLKPETILREHKIRSTIVVFGSARLFSAAEARAQIEGCRRELEQKPSSEALKRRLRQAQQRLEQSRYYEEARRFAQLISRAQQTDKSLEFVIVTGGGPGIMEAANRGAFESGSKSIGLNITLPQEQDPNPYITPGLSFQFHYFSLRKMHFLMRSRALAAFPGGYGTFDEVFETLTLVQTGKKKPIPIVLFGREFWQKAVNFEYLAEQGMISWEDTKLFKVVERAEEGWEYIQQFWRQHRGFDPTRPKEESF